MSGCDELNPCSASFERERKEVNLVYCCIARSNNYNTMTLLILVRDSCIILFFRFGFLFLNNTTTFMKQLCSKHINLLHVTYSFWTRAVFFVLPLFMSALHNECVYHLQS